MDCSCIQNIKEPYIEEQKKIYLTPHFDIIYENSPEWQNYIRFVCSHVILNGFWLEFGVFSGYTINTISTICNKIYGFDSFCGLQEQWGPLRKGMFSTNGRPPGVNNNVELVIGMFEETLPKFVSNKILLDKNPQIAFLHIDCDLYSSTKIIFDNLLPFIKKDTVIAFDEIHNYSHCLNGEMKALLETSLKYEYIAHTEYVQAAIRITE